MRLGKLKCVFLLMGLSVFSSCGHGHDHSDLTVSCPASNTSCTNSQGSSFIPTSGTADIPVYIADAGTTGQWNYFNEPLVSVTVCTPGHTLQSQCQTITNVLLDTGSYGFRVFSSVLNSNVQLSQQTITAQGQTINLAECTQFGTGSEWGAVKTADLILGSQTAVNLPIQVIDPNFATIPSSCADLCPDTDPCTAGYNGILGVGTFPEDCGAACANSADDSVNPGGYFGCDGTGCYDGFHGNCGSDGICIFQVPLAQQVLNPVASFSAGFNDGISLSLPSVGASGAAQVTTGNLHLGINSPNGVTLFPADSNGLTDGNGADFITTFEGQTYGGQVSSDHSTIAFIDSGSNALFFPSSTAQCSESLGLFCPSSSLNLTASMEGYNGTPSLSVPFAIGNADSLFGTGNSAFNNIGGPADGVFDWGLPFFYGRTVYVGLSGASSTVNGVVSTGPYWAY